METTGKRKFNLREIREDFPALRQTVYGKNLIYFDNGATSQKPQFVIDAINRYYTKDNANIHRGVHHLSQKATNEYEASRKTIATYLNAKHTHEIIFTKGTTEGINLVAYSFGLLLQKGDEVIISAMEHHSNIVPWQMLCERVGCVLKVIPINKKGEIIYDEYLQLLSEKNETCRCNAYFKFLGNHQSYQKNDR